MSGQDGVDTVASEVNKLALGPETSAQIVIIACDFSAHSDFGFDCKSHTRGTDTDIWFYHGITIRMSADREPRVQINTH